MLYNTVGSHIAGMENSLADDISCYNMSLVLQAFRPKAIENRASLQHPVLDLIVNVTGLDLTNLETKFNVQWYMYFEHALAATTRKTY